MTSELEVIRDAEITQENPQDIWSQCLAEWSTGASETMRGYLRQARAAATVARVHGTASVSNFAREVECSKSWVYDLAGVWWRFGHLLEDGDSSFSRRLESGLLTITHLIEAGRAKDPIGMLDAAEDEGLSSREIKARIKGEEEPENVERVEIKECPHCGSDSKYWARVPEAVIGG